QVPREMREMKRDVTLWLKKIYGNARVPQYEVNERTVDILHEVMECNEERDKDISLLIEDFKEREAKYEAEGEFESPFLIMESK
uniref:Uncharacterized protein n=1 Tax=Malurus cyaneus samueli TaxID=2593467 RepID=A0A8C5TYS0_9PASS